MTHVFKMVVAMTLLALVEGQVSRHRNKKKGFLGEVARISQMLLHSNKGQCLHKTRAILDKIIRRMIEAISLIGNNSSRIDHSPPKKFGSRAKSMMSERPNHSLTAIYY